MNMRHYYKVTKNKAFIYYNDIIKLIMKTLILNIIHSFRLAKTDIIKVQHEIIELRKLYEVMLRRMTNLEVENINQLNMINNLQVTKVIPKTHTVKTYIGSKNSTKFHTLNCPYGQNIKPKTKIMFKTKTDALNTNYKPCSCIK